MIWHFLEVWMLVAVSFAVGCTAGAALYGGLAEGPLALAQGRLADAVGDIVDWLKVRLGIGPAWRPELARSVPRPGGTVEEEEWIEPRVTLADDEPVLIDAEREATFVAVVLARTVREEPPPIEDDVVADEFAPEADFAPETTEDAAAVPAVPSVVRAAKPRVTPMRPAGLSKPRGGVPDNLTRMRGVGQRNEEVLNSLGIYHFSQIAAWTPGEVLWIGRYLAFPERIERDDWVSQAMLLATGGDTGFEKSAERRRKRRVEARQRAAAAGTLQLAPPADPAPSDDDADPDEDEG